MIWEALGYIRRTRAAVRRRKVAVGTVSVGWRGWRGWREITLKVQFLVVCDELSSYWYCLL